MLAWARFGRDSLPATAILASPLYLAGKLPIYLAYPFHRERQWIRTDRRAVDGATAVRRFGRDEMPSTTIEPVRFHAITEAECVAHMMDALEVTPEILDLPALLLPDLLALDAAAWTRAFLCA